MAGPEINRRRKGQHESKVIILARALIGLDNEYPGQTVKNLENQLDPYEVSAAKKLANDFNNNLRRLFGLKS
jgi:hypothetical protein